MRKALLQLIGYVLLDYDDHHAIRSVGVYFARHEWVTSWPLWVLMFPRAQVTAWVGQGEEPDEPTIAARLEKLRGLMLVAARGEPLELEASLMD